MKRIFSIICLCILWQGLSAQNYYYTEASDLTLVGKLMPGKTSNPYHRVDTTLYKGFTEAENNLVRTSSGMAIAFKTNSKNINILTEYGYMTNPSNTNLISARGYDLYIKKDGKWLWAGSGVRPSSSMNGPLTIVKSMDGSVHECLLYLPTFSEVLSVKIGVTEGSTIEALPNPFRHRVAIWGSSFTHGSCTTHAGMTYPAQFTRSTGIQMLSLGVSGRCLLQDYFCDVLCDVEADAFVFDSFSNPSATIIEERFRPFVDRMIAAHPGVPMIFQQTIYRESRNFNIESDKYEQEKMDMALAQFKALKSTPENRKKYKDVYFIFPNACSETHEATVDGVHPDNYGYTLWEKSVEKQIVRILKRYGIK